jgi:hypothetical protein
MFAGLFFPKYYPGHQSKTKEFAAKCSTYMTNDEYEILNRKLVIYVHIFAYRTINLILKLKVNRHCVGLQKDGCAEQNKLPIAMRVNSYFLKMQH